MASNERQELSSRLRELREAAGLSTTRLASALGWSQSKVSKIENGRTKPAVADVEAWLSAVAAPQDHRADLLEMAESIQVASIIWDRSLRGGRASHQRTIAGLLAKAAVVRVFQSSVVPGLLQTAEYARAAFRLADVFDLGDVGRAVAARIERQSALYEEGKRFEFVITEAALRFRAVTERALAAQYDKILSVSGLPDVTVSVTAMRAAPTVAHAHPFVIYELPDQTAFVTIETYTRELTLTDPEEIRLYKHVYESLKADAAKGPSMRQTLSALRDEAMASET